MVKALALQMAMVQAIVAFDSAAIANKVHERNYYAVGGQC